MEAVKSPDRPDRSAEIQVFLAGTIDNGVAEDWQDSFTQEMTSVNQDLQIFNPRRDDWDDTWRALMDEPDFVEQVDWEMEHLRDSDVIAMYFVPGSKSPITLLELGLMVGENRNALIVCCPDGFWRKGNVDYVCLNYLVQQVDTLEQLIESTKEKIAKI